MGMMVEFLWILLASVLGGILGAVIVWIGVQRKPLKVAILGSYHAFMGRIDRARPYFQEALQHDPDQYLALYYLGMDQVANRNFRKAAWYYERCLKQNPGDPNVLFRLGTVLYELRDFDRARGYWEQFLEVSRKESNKNQVGLLLKELNEGERNILNSPDVLDSFHWEEEGLTASRRISMFLFGCAVEGALLTSLLFAEAMGYW